MPDPLQLPANPIYCRTLTDPEFDRVRSDSGWPDPKVSCLVCRKENDGRIRARVGYANGAWNISEYQCDCVNQWILYHWFLNAGLKKDQQQFTWDQTYGVSPEALEQAKNYARRIEDMVSSGVGLTFHSPNKGTGKSLMAALILKQAMAKGVQRGFFVTFPQMISYFTDGWRDDQAKEWFSNRIKNAGLLVIDDIGREYKGNISLSEATTDLLFRHRASSGLPTIITTNEPPEGIERGYGEHVVSLLSETNIKIRVNSPFDGRKDALQQTIWDLDNGTTRFFTVGGPIDEQHG